MTFTIDLWQIACFIGSIAFLLLVMWIERQTPEERAAERAKRISLRMALQAERAAEECKRKELCKRQDRDIDLDGTTRYTVFEGSRCVMSTDDENFAHREYNWYCTYTSNHVRLFDGGTLIKERKEL